MVTTTVIGSYPIHPDPVVLMRQYFRGEEVSWKPYIASAVGDMVEAGVELVSDGQTRDVFTNIFLRRIGGCRVRGRVEVVDEVYYREPITIEDIRFVKGILPSNRKLLGLIVGPHTLSEYVVDSFYNDKEELSFAFARVLREEYLLLQDVVDMISIDEPSLSTSFPSYIYDLIEYMVNGIKIPIRLHICGDVSRYVDKIVDIPRVDVLSHEFKASPGLFDVFKEYECDKGFCIGCVRSDKPEVESIDEIIEHLNKAEEVFGEKVLQVAPDCGLRYLPRESAFNKLRNMVAAAMEVYKS